MYIEHHCSELDNYPYEWNEITISYDEDEKVWKSYIPTYQDIAIVEFKFCPFCGSKLLKNTNI